MGNCIYCGKQLKGRQKKYCSTLCERRSAYLRWYPNFGEERWRQEIYRKDLYYRYDFKCAICGWQLFENHSDIADLDGRIQKGNGCEIHHIIPLSKGGTSEWENLILLCPNCHKKADVGVIDVQTLKSKQKPVEDNVEIIEQYKMNHRSSLVKKATQK